MAYTLHNTTAMTLYVCGQSIAPSPAQVDFGDFVRPAVVQGLNLFDLSKELVNGQLVMKLSDNPLSVDVALAVMNSASSMALPTFCSYLEVSGPIDIDAVTEGVIPPGGIMGVDETGGIVKGPVKAKDLDWSDMPTTQGATGTLWNSNGFLKVS